MQTFDKLFEAAILSSGFGRRLGPAVPSKALIPFLGEPLVRRQLGLLRSWGVVKATLLARPTCELDLLREAVRNSALRCEPVHVLDWPGVYEWLLAWAQTSMTPMVTLNGDLLLDPSWGTALTTHRVLAADVTVAAVRDASGDGQFGKPREFSLNRDGIVVPGSGDTVVAHEIGMTVTSPRALRRLADIPNQAEDPWADEFIPLLIEEGYRVRITFGRGYWRDLGTWRRIWSAHADREMRYVAPSANVDPEARLSGWFWIGPEATISAGARIQNSVIGERATVAPDVQISNSFVGHGVAVDDHLAEQVVNQGHGPEVLAESLGT